MSRRTKKKRKNPLVQLRKPWKVQQGEDVSERSNWRDVQDSIGGGHAQGRLDVAFEVKTADGGHAEVAVYIVEERRFGNRQRSVRDEHDAPWPPPEEWPDEGLQVEPTPDELREVAEWVKEYASTIVRGEVRGNETFCVHHRPATDAFGDEDDPCTVDCEFTAQQGWQGLLRSFLDDSNFWGRPPWRAPVIVDNDALTLNEAVLTEAERKIFHRIKNDALRFKEYEETNDDAVGDVPEAAGASHLAAALLDGNYTSWDDHGSHTLKLQRVNPPTANVLWFDIIDHILLNLKEYAKERNWRIDEKGEKRVRDRFRKDLEFAIRHSFKAWHDYDARNTDEDLVFLTYERRNLVEQQLDDRYLADVDELLEGLTFEETEEVLEHVGEAAGRFGVEFERADNGMITFGIELDVQWWFTIDVDVLTRELEDLIEQESEEIEEDEEPRENPSRRTTRENPVIHATTPDIAKFAEKLLKRVPYDPETGRRAGWVIRSPKGDLYARHGQPFERYHKALKEAVNRHGGICPWCKGKVPFQGKGGHKDYCVLTPMPHVFEEPHAEPRITVQHAHQVQYAPAPQPRWLPPQPQKRRHVKKDMSVDDDNAVAIIAFLQRHGPSSATALYRGTGIERSIAYRYLGILQEQNKVKKVPRRARERFAEVLYDLT